MSTCKNEEKNTDKAKLVCILFNSLCQKLNMINRAEDATLFPQLACLDNI